MSEHNLRANTSRSSRGKTGSPLSWIMRQQLKPHDGVGRGAVCRSVEGLDASALNCNAARTGPLSNAADQARPHQSLNQFNLQNSAAPPPREGRAERYELRKLSGTSVVTASDRGVRPARRI